MLAEGVRQCAISLPGSGVPKQVLASPVSAHVRWSRVPLLAVRVQAFPASSDIGWLPITAMHLQPMTGRPNWRPIRKGAIGVLCEAARHARGTGTLAVWVSGLLCFVVVCCGLSLLFVIVCCGLLWFVVRVSASSNFVLDWRARARAVRIGTDGVSPVVELSIIFG